MNLFACVCVPLVSKHKLDAYLVFSEDQAISGIAVPVYHLAHEE